MHRDHAVFDQCLERKKKVKLTYFQDDYGYCTEHLCVPVNHNFRSSKDECSKYYEFYYVDAEGSRHFLTLSIYEIVSMKPTDESFDGLDSSDKRCLKGRKL